MKSKSSYDSKGPILVTVCDGVAEVWSNPARVSVEIIDFDNLLRGQHVTPLDTQAEWENLSSYARRHIRKHNRVTYREIQDRIKSIQHR